MAFYSMLFITCSMNVTYGQRSDQRDHEKCAAMRNILLLTYKGADPGDELEPKRGDGLFR